MASGACARLAIAFIVALVFPATAYSVANFDQYRFDIVALTGAGFTSFGDNVSINKHGAVAFVGTIAGVEQAYRAAIGAAPDALTNVPTAVYGRAVQINDGNLVVTRDRLGSGAPPPTRIRVWQFTGAFTQVAVGGNNQPYASVFSHPTINNNGAVVYTGLASGSLDTVMSNGAVNVPISAASARPMLADTGQVVLNDAGVLKLYAPDLGSFTTIASVGGGFTEIGNAPGVSDDASIVVFSGNRGAGRGIFASLALGGSRQTIRVAGEGAPANATRVNLPDLGFDDNGAPLFFSSIDLVNRVGVAHYPGGAAGLAGDSFIVAFLGTPNAESDPATRDKFVPALFFNSQRGLFTVRVDIVSTNPLKLKTHVAQPVMQVGSQLTVGGTAVTIADIQLHDPIDVASTDDTGNPLAIPLGSHRLAFWASDGARQYIFRAHQLNACLLPVVRLGQATPPWGNDHLAGHPQVTLQNKGCALAALTVAANRAAVDYAIDNAIDPGQFNVQMTNGNGFVGQNVTLPPGPTLRVKSVNWAKGVRILAKPGRLLSAATSTIHFEPFKRSTHVAAQAQEARDYLVNSLCDPLSPAPVIVGTDFVADQNGNLVPHHFVVVSGIANGKMIIADVGYGDVTTMNDPDNDYGNHFVTRGRIVDPTDLSSLTVSADDQVDFVVTDGAGRRVGYDPATNTEFQEVPGSAFFVDAMRDIVSGQAAPATTRSAILPQVATGTFTITVRGRLSGPFALQINGIDADGNDQPEIDLSGTIAAGAVKTYVIAYDGSAGGTTALASTTVPDVVGLAQAEAQAQIVASGLTVGTITQQANGNVPAGDVFGQSPNAGTIVAAGSAIALIVSTGAGSVTIVPNVVGQTQSVATTTLTNAGFKLGTVTQQSSSSVPAGNVISQTPTAGTSAAQGSAVNLVVSSGPALVAVPNVVGKAHDAATSTLVGVGLKQGIVTAQLSASVPENAVISQSPPAQAAVASGTAIDLVVSWGQPAPLAGQFTEVRSGFVFNRAAGTFDQTLTLKATTSSGIGVVFVSLASMPAGVSLANRTGNDPSGKPYVRAVPVRPLQAGDTITLLLRFTNPARTSLTYSSELWGS